MPEPKVIIRDHASRPRRPLVGGSRSAWVWVGWLACAFAVVGVGDLLLAWYPLRFGVPEWEFATIAQSFAGLPVVALGLVGLLGAGLGLDRRWLVLVSAVLLGLAGVGILLGTLLFLTDVPLALQTSDGIARVGIEKAVAKTLLLGSVFGLVFIAAAVAAVRRLFAR
jgi:hypothetical protein